MTFQEFLQKIEPLQAWRECYPRIYRDMERYGSPKVAAAAAVAAIEWVSDDYRNAPATARNIYTAVCKAREFDFPTLFIAPDLLAAVSETEPPGDLLWQEIKLPFEAGALCLPRGALRHPTDGACEILGWARIPAEEVLQFAPGRPKVKLSEDIFTVWTGLAEKENFPLLDTVLNAKTSPQLGDRSAPGVSTGQNRAGSYEFPLAENENEFLQQLRGIVFGALLAIEARPTLLSHGRRVGSHKKSHREIWEPNIIGRDYRIVRECGGDAGTHASPRLHWRRGHYRNQPYGAGRSQIRRIWIEPALIGE